MGGGSRHSKNAGTMGCEGMSYHERRALGFGTQKERLGKVRIAWRGRKSVLFLCSTTQQLTVGGVV